MRSPRHGLAGLIPAGVTVLIASLAGAGVASADPIDDQRSKVSQYADMIEALEEETAKLAEEYDIALDELGQLEEDVAAAEEAVAAKEVEVADLQAELGDVAVQAYLDSGGSGMGIFSKPAQFSEELQRDELTRVALNNGTADSDDLEQAVSELSEEQATLEDQQEAASAKAEEVAEAKEAAEDQTDELHEAQAEAEAELGNLIREEQERRARESWERIQAEAAAAQARADAQAAAATQAQQQASDANPTNSGGGGNTSSGGGGGNTSSGGGGGGNTTSGGGGGSSPAPAKPAGADPPSVLTGRHGGQRRGHPGRRRLPVCRGEPWRGLRLLRAHVVGMGHGRREPAAPVGAAVRQRPARAVLGRSTGRPDLLLLADQPRRHLHRRRDDDRRRQPEVGRPTGRHQLGQRHRGRPPELSAPATLVRTGRDVSSTRSNWAAFGPNR